MSELLGGLQDRSFARATAATAVSYPPERRLSAADWVSAWIRLTAERLLSYADENAVP